MDVYGVSVDDLLDLSNPGLFSSSSTTNTTANDSELHYNISFSDHNYTSSGNTYLEAPTTDFAEFLPSADVAELEWLSKYMDDSVTDFPANHHHITGTSTASAATSFHSAAAFHGRARTKRFRSTMPKVKVEPDLITEPSKPEEHHVNRRNSYGRDNNAEVARRCTHCASEKTPQWRTGPLGPKTLCNACGVRYKSGRLVPEYRPAASPTFVLTQHSNSHRKVLELRRQKELLRNQQQQQQQQGMYGRHFPVC